MSDAGAKAPQRVWKEKSVLSENLTQIKASAGKALRFSCRIRRKYYQGLRRIPVLGNSQPAKEQDSPQTKTLYFTA